ncbi:MAG TPA: ricin-type beta-trefoil lectin domain protein [Polyangiaceae bacterium]|nr:ricin-type beta-trefoil lectin domain protein [Polyangiaceae bacterium]
MLALVAGCAAQDGTEDGRDGSSELAASKQSLSNPIQLVNFVSQDQCLAVAAGLNKDGQAIVSWGCENSASQTWSFEGDQLRSNVGENKCLGVNEVARPKRFGGYTDGARGVLRTCSAYAPEYVGWKKLAMPQYSIGDGSECFRLAPLFDQQKVLGVLGGVVTSGKASGVWSDFQGLSHLDQVWCSRPAVPY